MNEIYEKLIKQYKNIDIKLNNKEEIIISNNNKEIKVHKDSVIYFYKGRSIAHSNDKTNEEIYQSIKYYLEKEPNYFTNFFSNKYFNERKYYRVKIDDDIIDGISFTNVETYFNYYRKKYKRNDLNLLGITIIPPTSLEQFLKIIKSHNKNNKIINELVKLTEKAIENNWHIIHYGV